MALHCDKYKTVLFPIRVPVGTFCHDAYSTCGHFENIGGVASCRLGFWPLRYNAEGDVPKPEDCRKLTRPEKFRYVPENA